MSHCSVSTDPWNTLDAANGKAVRQGLHLSFDCLINRRFPGSSHLTETQHLLLIFTLRKAAEAQGDFFGTNETFDTDRRSSPHPLSPMNLKPTLGPISARHSPSPIVLPSPITQPQSPYPSGISPNRVHSHYSDHPASQPTTPVRRGYTYRTASDLGSSQPNSAWTQASVTSVALPLTPVGIPPIAMGTSPRPDMNVPERSARQKRVAGSHWIDPCSGLASQGVGKRPPSTRSHKQAGGGRARGSRALMQ